MGLSISQEFAESTLRAFEAANFGPQGAVAAANALSRIVVVRRPSSRVFFGAISKEMTTTTAALS